MPFSQCPAKLGGYIGPFPLTLPKYLPAAALQVLGQYCLCSGEITAPSWPSSQGRRDGQRTEGYQFVFLLPLLQLVPEAGLGQTKGLGDMSPWEGVPDLPHWVSSAPKLPGARPVASEKLYELFGRERVVNYHVPLLLTSANKSNYHRLMNRARAHPRSCR